MARASGVDLGIIIAATVLFLGALGVGLWLIYEFNSQARCYGDSNGWCKNTATCADVPCTANCNVALLDTKPSALDPCCVKRFPGLFAVRTFWYCMDPDVDPDTDPLCNKGVSFCDGSNPCPAGYTCVSNRCQLNN